MWHLAGYPLLGGCLFFFCSCFLKIFLIAHVGYLHCTSTFSRCCSSCSANSGVELMVRALCERVLITLYLAAILWLLSHGRYRSVCVGFLYTPMVKVPSASGLMMVSRKGMEPSFWLPPQWIWWMDPLNLGVGGNLLYVPGLVAQRYHLHTFSHILGGCRAVFNGLVLKCLHKDVGHNWTYMVDPMAAPLVCS